MSNIVIVDSCESINFGILSEQVLTYSINDRDTILERTTIVNFNKRGLTLKAVSFSESFPDTSITVMEYDSAKILGWKEFMSGHNDTTTYQAVAWNQKGRGTKFVLLGEEGAYSIFAYNNCVTTQKKTFSNNELIYSIDYHWDGSLLNKTTSQFYGSLKEAIGQSISTTESDFEKFDEKGNWTQRSFTIDKTKHLELRYLSYY
ncbi:MAG: hypothetical protein AAF502_21625 [Bacteroidota bacterium]